MIHCRCSNCGEKTIGLMEKGMGRKARPVVCSSCHASGYVSPLSWWLLNMAVVFFTPFIFIYSLAFDNFGIAAITTIGFLIVFYFIALFFIPINMKDNKAS